MSIARRRRVRAKYQIFSVTSKIFPVERARQEAERILDSAPAASTPEERARKRWHMDAAPEVICGIQANAS